ncbi:hypothetical protein EV191_101790 [Tamaricihabitans halophyticus]|uniref:Uncharacterized protein n=1 Tax=Tamaricihabitans halophyticus TaxID=1262583 RepID=A0A4R2R2R6_9PSEU|nr:hypothetical protein [Tamaricihabitans halophyticus]TCP56843.1 hypothetical protein EV191_101790 [Tamaricihabitans halophyticus]
MRLRRTFLAAAAASMALAIGGCSEANDNAGQQQDTNQGEPSSPASEPSGSAQPEAGTKWIDGFCGSMGGFAQAMQGIEQPQSQDPAEVKQQMSGMLGTVTKSAGKIVSDMDELGPSPLEGGDRLASGVRESYGELQRTATSAKSTVDDASTDDPQATMQAVQSANQELGKVDLQQPFTELQDNKTLASAAQHAPNCQALAEAAQQQQQQQQQQPGQPGGGADQPPPPGN